MELKIDIDETKFKEVIEKELGAFSSEELHQIIRECIVESLHNDNSLKNLFITKKINSWGTETEEPSEVLITAAKNIDLSPAYEEIQTMMIDTLKNNHQDLLEKVMLSMIIKGLSNDYDFKNTMETTISEIMYRMHMMPSN